ncbi:hypothetical protein EZJ55_07265 [Microcystis aeruginosa EAWAG127a]|uniref:Uncharacterized protein n=1 Tax=Microcystis aeruginosa EAWAG127a TaxID=2529855 RepID=A0A5J5LT70_MICAE|nr:hypothetical protein EZJ55_07265 [Microcystis aeruginosa EAWAG127a]
MLRPYFFSRPYLSKINYTYLTISCLLPIFTRKLILYDYLSVISSLKKSFPATCHLLPPLDHLQSG